MNLGRPRGGPGKLTSLILGGAVLSAGFSMFGCASYDPVKQDSNKMLNTAEGFEGSGIADYFVPVRLSEKEEYFYVDDARYLIGVSDEDFSGSYKIDDVSRISLSPLPDKWLEAIPPKNGK